MGYLNRLIESKIEESLKEVGCVVIEGAKWCGKSTTSKRYSSTLVDFQLPMILERYQIYTHSGDKELLAGETPILFNEWQKNPSLWDYIRTEVDNRHARGQFIITGSTMPIQDNNRHSGVGRMKKIKMYPMSLWESNESTGDVSLSDLFNQKNISIHGESKHTLMDITKIICTGGWPEAVQEEDYNKSSKLVDNYIDELINSEIPKLDDIKRSPLTAKAILASYARSISTSSSLNTLTKSIESIKDWRTVESYIDAFRNLYIIDEVEAWEPQLLSKATIRKSSTRQLVDPSIAASILELTPNDLIGDFDRFSLLFKSLATRDLRIYSSLISGSVYKYSDSNDLDIDTIIQLNNGRWGAIQIILGDQDSVDYGAKALLLFKNNVDLKEMGEPSFLAIITATSYSYQRKDGVYVIPIGCLKN